MSTIPKPKMREGSLVEMIWDDMDIQNDMKAYEAFNKATKELEKAMIKSLSDNDLNHYQIRNILGFEND